MSKITGEGSPAEMLLKGIKADAEPQKKPKQTKSKATADSKPKKQATKQNADSENRSRRVQCVFTPSLYEELSNKAWENRISVNEAIVQAVTEYIERR